jgi:hypothetical protein
MHPEGKFAKTDERSFNFILEKNIGFSLMSVRYGMVGQTSRVWPARG